MLASQKCQIITFITQAYLSYFKLKLEAQDKN